MIAPCLSPFCYKCGFEHHGYKPPPASKPAPDIHREIKRAHDAPIENAGSPDSAPATDSKIVEIEIEPFAKSRDFHKGAPLKGPPEPWRNHVGVAGALTPDPHWLARANSPRIVIRDHPRGSK